MSITLEAIKFNHDPASATTNALTIRKNGVEDVAVPEWKRGMTLPEESPAAYTIAQTLANNLTIRAQFRRENSSTESVEIYARAGEGNVLGNVRPKRIVFQNDLSEFELFELESPRENCGVGVYDISWDWYADDSLLLTTKHRIYTLVDAPQFPWGQPGCPLPDFQLPWTEVLEHACRAATGAQTVDYTAEKLTRWIHSLGSSKLRYDQNSGSSNFTIAGMQTFKCTKFLTHLAAGPGEIAKVNCTDCATILSSFANILGCNLFQSRIGFEFPTNLIQEIGMEEPFRKRFRYHEVAWKFPLDETATLFDSGLQVDGDCDLTDNNFLPKLGINVPMGAPDGDGYRARLIAPTPNDIQERPGTRVQRKIDGVTIAPLALDPDQRRFLEREYDFSSWSGVSTNGHNIFLKNLELDPKRFSPCGWKPGEVEVFRGELDLLKLTDVVWSASGCSGASLRVLTYECSSIKAARLFLLSLLGNFEVPGVKRRKEFILDQKQVTIGDVAFSGPDDLALLFARANAVVSIQNVGRTLMPASQFAYEIDSDITNNPDSTTVNGTKWFQVCNGEIHVGDEVPIRALAGSYDTETLFKFFAPSGEVFLKETGLVYRSSTAGEQLINILGIRASSEAARQVLTFSAEPTGVIGGTTMPNVRGRWSSRLPTTDGTTPTDLSVDGVINITGLDLSGVVSGTYTEPGSTVALTGSVTSISTDVYTIALSHSMGTGITRHYEGQLVATDVGFGIQIVVGTYYDETAPTPAGGAAAGTGTSVSALTSGESGQESGTWVATKP